MHVYCSEEQTNFNFAYTFSVDIEMLLLMKYVNRDRNIIEQYLAIWNLKETDLVMLYIRWKFTCREYECFLYMYVEL